MAGKSKRGKAPPGSAKAVANRLKARGLGKLRFYCQMCEKQCRDENGFKCHCMSEAHLRKMQLFASNQDKFLDDFSADFEKGFVDLLSRRHQSKFVDANAVYNEYIQERDHVHMNATRWTTLSHFVKHLIEDSSVRGEETDRGFRIQWINRDPTHVQRQLDSANLKKRRLDTDDEDRRRKLVEGQLKALGEAAPDEGPAAPSSVDDEGRAKLGQIRVSLQDASSSRKRRRRLVQDDAASDDDEDEEEAEAGDGDAEEKGKADESRGVDNQEVAARAGREPGALHRGDFLPPSELTDDAGPRPALAAVPSDDLVDGSWLVPGLVVKIVSSKVGRGNLKKQKAVVVTATTSRSSGKVKAELQLMDNPDEVVMAKESHLETVLPDVGGPVLVVSPKSDFTHRGCRAVMQGLVQDQYKARVRLSDGSSLLLDYDNVCRYLDL